nr:hypothetical protein [Tanacetum cinerariifolium]
MLLLRISHNFLILKEVLMSQMFHHLMWMTSSVGMIGHEGPSEITYTKIASLRLKFIAFKALEGEKDEGVTRVKACMAIIEDEPAVGKTDVRPSLCERLEEKLVHQFQLS